MRDGIALFKRLVVVEIERRAKGEKCGRGKGKNFGGGIVQLAWAGSYLYQRDGTEILVLFLDAPRLGNFCQEYDL